MLEIGKHIERLLVMHDCVIVPSWGGFVLRSLSAVCDREGHMFTPRRREIVFNATLTHNDGLLTESYMQTYGVDYNKAQLMVDEDVAKMKALLHEEKTLRLGALGRFDLGSEGQMVFYPGNSPVLSVDSYGLETFHMTPLQHIHEGEKKDTLYIPVSRRFLRVAVASAAAVALFFLVSTPVRDVERSAYTASFVPSMVMEHAPVAEPAEAEPSGEAPKMAVVEAPKNIDAELVKAETPKAMPAGKKYHIVVGSFPSKEQASKFMTENKDDAMDFSMVERDGRCRVCAYTFSNREEAESRLATLRTNEKYKDAWLFICR